MIYLIVTDENGRNKSRPLPVERDELGYPLLLASVTNDVDIRQAISEMEPGDKLELRTDD